MLVLGSKAGHAHLPFTLSILQWEVCVFTCGDHSLELLFIVQSIELLYVSRNDVY